MCNVQQRGLQLRKLGRKQRCPLRQSPFHLHPQRDVKLMKGDSRTPQEQQQQGQQVVLVKYGPAAARRGQI
jgi:hypothetical protein